MPVTFRREGPVAVLCLENEARRNVLNRASLRALVDGAERAEREGARALIIESLPDARVFCAGYDLAELAALQRAVSTERDSGADAAGWVEAEEHPLEVCLARLDALSLPLIVVAHGPAIGGGVLLLLAADLRLMSDDAWLSVPAARVGVVYPARGLERLVAGCGQARTMELLLTGRRLPAAEAQGWGLLNRIAPRAALRDEARQLADRIARGAPLSHTGHRQLVRALCEQRARAERQRLGGERRARAARSADHQEALAALAGKRPPRFEGR